AHYVGLLARMLRLAEDVVASEIRRLALVRPARAQASTGAQRTATPTPPSPAAPQRAVAAREAHLLALPPAYPAAAHDVAAEVALDDFASTTNRLLWETLRPAIAANPRILTADLLTAVPGEELREVAGALVAALGERPAQFPGPIRQEIRDTL